MSNEDVNTSTHQVQSQIHLPDSANTYTNNSNTLPNIQDDEEPQNIQAEGMPMPIKYMGRFLVYVVPVLIMALIVLSFVK